MTYDTTHAPGYHLAEAARLLRLLKQTGNCHTTAMTTAIAYQAQVHIELAKALQNHPLSAAEWDEACV